MNARTRTRQKPCVRTPRSPAISTASGTSLTPPMLSWVVLPARPPSSPGHQTTFLSRRIVAQNEELTTEAFEAEELTSYTSESVPAEAAPKKERPALTVAGAAVGRRKEAVARVRVVPGSGKW